MRLRTILAGFALYGLSAMNLCGLESKVARAEETVTIKDEIKKSFTYNLGGNTPEDYAPRDRLRRELTALKPKKGDDLATSMKKMLSWMTQLEDADKEKKTLEDYVKITKELPGDEGKKLRDCYKPNEFFSDAKASITDAEDTKRFLTRWKEYVDNDEIAEQIYFRLMDAFAKYEMLEEEVRWFKEKGRKPSWGMILVPGGEIEFGNGSKESIERLINFAGWMKNENYSKDPSLPRFLETPANKHFTSYLAIESEFHEKRRIFNGGSFEIGRFEIRNKDFMEFLEANPGYETPMYAGEFGNNPSKFKFNRAERSFPEGSEDYPVVNITPDDLKAYAKWLSKKESREYSVPNEIQFESVSRSFDGREFARGNRTPGYPHRGGQANNDDLEKMMDLSLSAYGFKPAGSYWFDTSVLGAKDVMANVAEIVTTDNDPRPGLNENERDAAKRLELRGYFMKQFAQKGVGAGFKESGEYDIWKYFEVCHMQARNSARESIARDWYSSTLGGRLVRKLQ